MHDALANARWEIAAAIAGAVALGAVLVAWRGRRGRGGIHREFDAYAQALQALLRDDLDAAVRILSRAAEINSERVSTYLSLGVLLRRKGDFDRALRLHQNLSLRPGLGADERLETLREAARDELAARRPREALALVGPLLEKHGRDAVLLEIAEEAHLALGEWDAALEAGRRLDRATGVSRPALRAHLLAERGRRLAAEGDLPGAKKALQKAIDADPKGTEALAALGDAYLAEKKPKKAIETWERILDLDPRWIGWLVPRLEQACFETGEVERLDLLIRRQIARRPQDAALHLLLARHLAKKQRREDALGALKQAADLAPADVAVRRERVRLLVDRGPGADLESEVEALIDALPAGPPGFRCSRCGTACADPLWRCAACGATDSIRFNETSPSA